MGYGRKLLVGALAAATVTALPPVTADATAPRRAPGSLPIAWQFDLPGVVQAVPPIAWGHRVIEIAVDTAHALDAATGAPIWHTTVPGDVVLGAPTLFHDTIDSTVSTGPAVAVATFDGNGNVTVSSPQFHQLRGQLVADRNTSVVVAGAFGSGVGPLYTIDFGGHTWFLSFGPNVPIGVPRISGGRVFVPVGGTIAGIDPAQGCTPLPPPSSLPYCVPTWSTGLTGLPNRPSFGGAGRVAASDSAGAVTVIDAATGAVVWQRTYGTQLTPTTYAGGVLFVAGLDGTLRAIDVATGTLRWTGVIASHNVIATAPTVANGVVWIATDDGHVRDFTANGCGAASCSPIADGDTGRSLPSRRGWRYDCCSKRRNSVI